MPDREHHEGHERPASIREFLLARVRETEAPAPWARLTRLQATAAAIRQVIELHDAWPVLVESPPVFEQEPSTDPTQLTARLSQRISWETERSYREKFGSEPPTAPILRVLAGIWSDHPDFDPAWGQP